jgi:phosphoribosyl 1,2-cyclic phosphodiesterase
VRLASLGSGSEGNCWLFECGHGDKPSRIMVDCGFAVKETVSRLARIGLNAADIDAIVVTHEHGDHISGVFKFSRKFGTPVFLTHGTWRSALRSGLTDQRYLKSGCVILIESHTSFQIEGLILHPFPVPHDAAEPIQLLIESKTGFITGMLTDCGCLTPHLLDMLNRAQAVILESNHCTEMLANSSYPQSLKRRVGGDYGHLSNQVACKILNQLDSGNLRFAVAAHLSQTTNCPKIVQRMWQEVLEPKGVKFEIACQVEGFAWRNLDFESLAA